MNTSTSAGISQRTLTYAEVTMLEHAEPVMVLEKFGTTKPMPKNKGVKIKMRRPKPFEKATTPLLEGVTPTSSSFGYEDVEGTLKQYGDVATFTDVIEDTHEDPVVNDMSMMCGENIGATKEALMWGVLRGGTNVFYANGTSRSQVNTPITKTKQRAVTRALKNQKAKKITKILSSSVNYGTQSVEASYIAVAHSDLESDIREMAGFTAVADYGQRKPVCPEEIGSVEDVRYVLSPDLDAFLDAGGAKGSMVSASGTSADVYPVLFFGKEAYGTVPLRGEGAVDPSIIPASKKTKDDPLGQRGIVGWKTWFLAMILNQAWMARLECAVTDL